MSHPLRRILAVGAGIGATLVLTAGVALADSHDDGNSHHPNGTGSGLSGGPTDTYALPEGAPPVPLSDPTLGEGTALPPAYNALGGLSG
jgi:hypothetical protein